MKKQLETREYSLKNGLILKGVVDADSGKIYFPIQALAKAVGYSVDQAKGFKKLVLRESAIKSLFEFKEIPTKLKGQRGWVIYEESLPNLMLRFPKLRDLTDKFPKEEEIEQLKKEAVVDLNSIFPSFSRLKKVLITSIELEGYEIYIRDMRPRVSLKTLSKFFEVKQSYLEKEVEMVTKGYARKYYSFEHKDLTIEGFNLLSGFSFCRGPKLNKLLENFSKAQEYLIKEVYAQILREMSPELHELYLLENVDMGTIKIGISKKLDKRILELGAGSYKMVLLYSSKLISNAMEIKEDIMKELKPYQRRNDWIKISPDEVLEIVKKYEKKMYVKKIEL